MGRFFYIFENFPVKPYSIKGKILVAVLRVLYGIIAIFKKKDWSLVFPNFEENPLYYTKKEILYFGYKYYFSPPLIIDKQVFSYFKNQNLIFDSHLNKEVISCVTLSAGGDLMPYQRINNQNCSKLWDEVGEWFFSSDIVFGNLETPICLNRPSSVVPEVMLNDMLFNANKEMFDIFSGNKKFKGFDILSTANNHSFDQGEIGIKATLDFLKKEKVLSVGTQSESNQPKFTLIEKNNISVAFIAFTFSLNHLELPENKDFLVNHLRINKPNVPLKIIKDLVKEAKETGADFVVLSAHTGNAYQPMPSPHTIEIYHRIFSECGVDIILGSHPHNPQPMEKYDYICPFTKTNKSGFAIYSLGDFVAYDIFVWDRLVPLLKLDIVKIKDEGIIKTVLKSIKIKPTFNWGNPNGKEMRFLDLKKWISADEFPTYFTENCQLEMLELNRFCDTYLLPDNQNLNLLD
jgi:hypothetical protein